MLEVGEFYQAVHSFPLSIYSEMLAGANRHHHFPHFSTNFQKFYIQTHQISCLTQLVNQDNQMHLPL